VEGDVKCWSDIVYGPVASRRLGRSLGVNILPACRRTCNFNCVYCQYGAEGPVASPSHRPRFPSPESIAAAVQSELKEGYALDVVTIAGNGEPTLHPDFRAVVDALVAVRDRGAGIPIAILSNSSRVSTPEVREALLRIDRRIMKLDAANQPLFAELNRPLADQRVEEIIQGLCLLRPLTIQTLFISGEVDNSGDEQVDDLVEAYRQIDPEEVQVYSTARYPAEPFVLPVPQARLEVIAEHLRAAGVPARVYG
jgi:wyosine [tRNA(Phe)-imidazoG37] synthetase (radical SAM superfamily)